MAEEQIVIVERDGPVGVVLMNRPDKLNALSSRLVGAVADAMQEFDRDREIRAIVLGGGERAFAAGADIEQMRGMSPAEAEGFSRLGHRVFGALEALPVPTIAAVNGYALGGGCELACACDWIYASAKARFGQPEVNLGIIPGFGGTSRLARRVGIARAKEMVLGGAPMTAEEALRVGLVNRVFPPEELLDGALAVGETIAAKGPLAVAAAKRVMQEGQDVDPRVAHTLEQHAFGLVFSTEDRAEGMAAFLEKRDPVFKGR